MNAPGEASHFPELDRLLVEQMADALIFADRRGIIRRWNAGAEKIFGFKAAEVLGVSLDVIIPERLRAAHWAGFNRAMETGAARLDGRPIVTRAVNAAGDAIYVDLSFAVVADGNGVVLGSVALARDATIRYREDKALRQRLAEFEHRA